MKKHCDENNIVGFEVFTALVMKNIIFRDMTPCATQRTTQRHIPEDDTLQNNIDFNVLLILDNASAPDLSFVSSCHNINVVYLPPCITSVIQPVDQCVISVLKAYYLRYTYHKLIAETNAEYYKKF
jgi:hypothetical protein